VERQWPLLGAALALELDAVILRERPSHDSLQILDSPPRAGVFAIRGTRQPSPDRLAPKKVHGALPARME
jgi:hypothetical protein